MDAKLNDTEVKKLKELLASLKAAEVSQSTRQKFFSKLDEIDNPQTAASKGRSPAIILKQVMEDIAYGLRNALSVPKFVYARVAVLSFIAVSLYSYAYLPQLPAVHDLRGIVKVFDSGRNEWVFASEGMRLGKEDILKTFEDGSADISLGGVYAMRLKRNSEMKVSSLSSRATRSPIEFDIAKGTVLTYYAGSKAGSRKDLNIRTEELVASAIGTNFMVESIPLMQKSSVGVLDGIVMVRSLGLAQGASQADSTVFVKSKYRTEVSAGQIPKKPETMIEDEWLRLEELYSVGKKPQVALLISTGLTRTRELLSLAPLYISDKEPSVLPDKLASAAKLFNQAAKEDSTAGHEAAIRAFEDIVEQYPDPKYDVQFYLFIASYYERIGAHKKAVDTFEKVISKYPKSSLAGVAELAIGYISEEGLSDPARAKEAYRKVISEYPQSPEAEEALAGLRRVDSR